MEMLIPVNTQSNHPKYKQILEGVIASIEKGRLERGQQLPSINELAQQQNIAKVTVAKAYEELRQRGIITAKQGKGFYVASTEVKNSLNVFLLFDTLNAYKETLFYALKATLPENARLNLFFHHYDQNLFQSLIKNNLGNYQYYVVMPHFNQDISAIVRQIPLEKLVVLDKTVPKLKGDYAAVYQDFEKDIQLALTVGIDLLKRYTKLTLVLSKDQFQFVPEGIITGFKKFAKKQNIACAITDKFTPDLIKAGESYLLFADRDLISFIKYVHEAKLKLGREVGLISYDDTPMKEILEGGITVISTDFEQMGRTTGQLILERRKEQITNSTRLIQRKSL
ncbi:GntR family transcriptional regulator [Adhaeribacter arboris]|uniref:GntR family transcriptional regulator n=1 Tax=Adhaeribacter arboris TaxID=2072846 RepID=A0A2T2YNG2_9BACT|nr:GntR family transcriptional regulator [Adhaeribacter arboris]PSR57047.1 GntR family transcriptional regulator [Adhaeribacter arboris]